MNGWSDRVPLMNALAEHGTDPSSYGESHQVVLICSCQPRLLLQRWMQINDPFHQAARTPRRGGSHLLDLRYSFIFKHLFWCPFFRTHSSFARSAWEKLVKLSPHKTASMCMCVCGGVFAYHHTNTGRAYIHIHTWRRADSPMVSSHPYNFMNNVNLF